MEEKISRIMDSAGVIFYSPVMFKAIQNYGKKVYFRAGNREKKRKGIS